VTPLRSFLTPSFRKLYRHLPSEVQTLADEKYRLFQQDPFHPSLEFEAKGKGQKARPQREKRIKEALDAVYANGPCEPDPFLTAAAYHIFSKETW